MERVGYERPFQLLAAVLADRADRLRLLLVTQLLWSGSALAGMLAAAVICASGE
jgi:hypothetical protein